uniref:flagellar hook-associated protein FlgK n=1 Tax=Aliarcobacter sp. TaxID=2321116 RepID=UPI0040488063
MLNTLNVAHSGLNAAKIAVENVSNNIANENTPGYKKRVVQLNELEQIDARFTGRGVSSDGAYRVTSQYMYDKLISENTKTNYYEKLSSMLGNVESIFKETDNSGFSSDLDRYFQSIENLRSNPNSEINKTTLKNQGEVIVEALQHLYTSVEKMQALEKDELYDNVEKINNILDEIGSINEKLGDYSKASNDLLDKRDQLELELSKYVDINVVRTSGDYELQIAGVTAVRYSTNIRDVNIVEDNQAQIDKYTLIDSSVKPNVVYDAMKYNSDFTPRTFDANDIVTYKLNNEHEISVTIGTYLKDSNGNDVDLDGDNLPDLVDENNLTRALVYEINTNINTKSLVTAYNGDYSLDSNGEKVLNTTSDKFLRIDSNVEGISGSFEGRISIQKVDNNDSSIVESRDSIYKSEYQSTEASTNVSLSIFDNELPIKSGMLKPQLDNLSSDSLNNKYQGYLDKLDAFAQTLADVSDKYIKTGSDEYIYGEALSDKNSGKIDSIGLFSGSSVKTLTFNKNAVNDLNQDKLDYLSTFQWKKDFSFDGFTQGTEDSNKTSLSGFYQELRGSVSLEKESVDFYKDTQKNVEQSLKSSYDQLTKVDKDEEMLNLVKFQAAYTANAKIITVIDEMLNTLLGLKR